MSDEETMELVTLIRGDEPYFHQTLGSHLRLSRVMSSSLVDSYFTGVAEVQAQAWARLRHVVRAGKHIPEVARTYRTPRFAKYLPRYLEGFPEELVRRYACSLCLLLIRKWKSRVGCTNRDCFLYALGQVGAEVWKLRTGSSEAGNLVTRWVYGGTRTTCECHAQRDTIVHLIGWEDPVGSIRAVIRELGSKFDPEEAAALFALRCRKYVTSRLRRKELFS